MFCKQPLTALPQISARSLCLFLLAGLMLPGCGNQKQKAENLVRSAVEQQDDGQYEDAVATLTRSLALRPDFAEAFYLRGTCHGALGDYDQAVKDLQSATKHRPEWDRAWWALGTMQRSAGDIDSAEEALSLSIKLNPDAADAYFDRGCVYMAKGDADAALADFGAGAPPRQPRESAERRCIPPR